MKLFIVLIALLIPLHSISQPKSKISKYSFGIGIDFGHSPLTIDQAQNRWETNYNPAFALNIEFINRINQQIMVNFGIGFTAYGLILRGKIDKYIIDFASPHLSTGITYNFKNRKGNEPFIKMSTGLQLGYKKRFVDEFESYTVTIEGENQFYHFIKPEIGFRKYLNKKIKGTRFKAAYEFGAFFRINLNTLGKVTITELDFETNLEPRGNIIGGYVRFVFPVGRKRIKMKDQEIDILPPIIYNPRYMD